MLTDAALAAIAEEYGTPAYVYDLDAVVARVRELRSALPDRVDLAYAVKANPAHAVLAAIAMEGIGADVASAGELLAVERAGFDLGRVVFTGPGKRDDELAAAVARDLRAITVESIGELERLRAIAGSARRRARVMLRASAPDRPGNVIGSGSGGRFGMRPVDLARAAQLASTAPELELVGLHRFGAGNVLSAAELLDLAAVTIAIAGDLGVPLTVIDIGGGLGIPYAAEEPLDVAAVGAGLAALLEELAPAVRLLVEPGRYLVGPCGAYLVRVLDVKRSDEDLLVATVDGGIHHLLRPALTGGAHRIRHLASDAASREPVEVVVGGPLCTALDVLGRVRMPPPRAGDLLAVLDAGAYGFTESMPLFLSHPLPPEVMVRGRRTWAVRTSLGPRPVDAQAMGA